MRTGFRIGGLRHVVSDTLKKRMGVRNYRVLCGAIVVALLGAVTIPMALKGNDEESYAINALANPLDVRFLNTQDYEGVSENETSESVLLKTYDNKYVLIDTGNEDDGVVKMIYDALNGWQNGGVAGSEVTIDYLIVSHLDGDHKGNVTKLMRKDGDYNKYIRVENVIVKYEKEEKPEAYRNIVYAAMRNCLDTYDGKCTHVYTSNNVEGDIGNGEMATLFNSTELYNKFVEKEGGAYKNISFISENGFQLPVGGYVNLYFYNVNDVYAGKECNEGNVVRWVSDSTKATKFDGETKSIFYKASDGEFYTQAGEGRKEFYAMASFDSDGNLAKISTCRSNANSYGVLAEVKTKKDNKEGKKFAYFTNDLDNIGYSEVSPSIKDINFSYNNGLGAIESGLVTNYEIFGNSAGVVYFNFDCKSNNSCTNKDLETQNKNNRVAAQSRAALGVAAQITNNSGSLSDLVIYQQPHHGQNNAADTTDTLGLTSASGITTKTYAVSNRKTTWKANWLSNYMLHNGKYAFRDSVEELVTGTNGGSVQDGVSCRIRIDGTYYCGRLTVNFTKKSIEYDANGGTGAPAEESCGTIDNTGVNGSTYLDRVCQETVTDVRPSRSEPGYNFLGWATSSDATVAEYEAGDLIELSKNITTLYAVWEPQPVTNTLLFDANGGNSAPNSQTCMATVPAPSCTVKISLSEPSREHYAFLGWAKSSDAIEADYEKGSIITIDSDQTLYAVWHRVINVNTSVNGVGGAISPSMTDIKQGSTVVVTFTPDQGYEIDNVTVNGELAAVVDNQLEIIAQDTDINVVVTYKEASVEPDPEETRTFFLAFSGANMGSGFPATQTCTTTTDSCTVVIPSTPVPEQEGYVFLGYGLFSDWDVVVATPGESYTLTGNTYLLAVWAPIYTLVLDVNGGAFPAGATTILTCNPITVDGGCNITLSFTDPTRAGYDFMGWATTTSATTAEYANGDTITMNSDITLYAVWQEKSVTYTLSFDANAGGDTVTNMPEVQTYGPVVDTSHTFTIPAEEPTRQGYEFAGWYIITAPEYIYNSGSNIIVTSESPSVTLYAKWSAEEEEKYEILDISSDEYEIGSGEPLVIRGSGALNKFSELRIDGIRIAEEYYTLAEGSTIVTLSADYLDTLSVGSHVATLVWVDGEVSTDFMVIKNGEDEEPDVPVDPVDPDDEDDDYIPVPNTSAGAPDTGGNTGNNIGGNVALVALPVVMMVAGMLTRKYRRNKAHRKFDW